MKERLWTNCVTSDTVFQLGFAFWVPSARCQLTRPDVSLPLQDERVSPVREESNLQFGFHQWCDREREDGCPSPRQRIQISVDCTHLLVRLPLRNDDDFCCKIHWEIRRSSTMHLTSLEDDFRKKKIPKQWHWFWSVTIRTDGWLRLSRVNCRDWRQDLVWMCGEQFRFATGGRGDPSFVEKKKVTGILCGMDKKKLEVSGFKGSRVLG